MTFWLLIPSHIMVLLTNPAHSSTYLCIIALMLFSPLVVGPCGAHPDTAVL